MKAFFTHILYIPWVTVCWVMQAVPSGNAVRNAAAAAAVVVVAVGRESVGVRGMREGGGGMVPRTHPLSQTSGCDGTDRDDSDNVWEQFV